VFYTIRRSLSSCARTARPRLSRIDAIIEASDPLADDDIEDICRLKEQRRRSVRF